MLLSAVPGLPVFSMWSLCVIKCDCETATSTSLNKNKYRTIYCWHLTAERLHAAICLFSFPLTETRDIMSFAQAPLAMWNLFVFACHGGVCLNLCPIAHRIVAFSCRRLHYSYIQRPHAYISCISLHPHFKQTCCQAGWGAFHYPALSASSPHPWTFWSGVYKPTCRRVWVLQAVTVTV